MVWNDSKMNYFKALGNLNLYEVVIITREEWSNLSWNGYYNYSTSGW